MVKPEDNQDTPVKNTGHVWDGIRELDNPLPRWWLWVWLLTVLFAIGYWVAMPAWPGISGYTKGVLGLSDRASLGRELADLDRLRGAQMVRLRNASLEQIEATPDLQSYALMVGGSVFGDNCAGCHGIGGTGSAGYANLRDDVWLWGGTLADIQHTITVGVRSGAEGARDSRMPSFGRDKMMTPAQIGDMTEYVVALSGRQADRAAVDRAAPLYAQNCVACHGEQGLGVVELGAPNLTDKEWLYGASREAIQAQIFNGRAGVMPAWGARFSPETIKALTVYVHANAAGQ
jgi:cytochrome c oxidase cbb3-type subunit 3